MANVAVVGSQWGDEGKGKIVDWLSSRADVVVRYQGGHNAGHTLVINGIEYKLSLLPSGVVRPGKLSVIGNGVVVDPWALLREIDAIRQKGVEISPENLMIAENATLILPIHGAVDRAREEALGNLKIGTTGRGIGPAYEDKVARRAIRLCDLADEAVLEEKVDKLLFHHNALLRGLGSEEVGRAQLLDSLREVAPLVRPTPPWCGRSWTSCARAGKRILFEGAQGAMLDVDHGTYPYVTSSNTVSGNAATGSGMGPGAVGYVLGITKAYTTRVGSGPFPSEQINADGERLGERGREFGTVTGRKRRCGWFDAVHGASGRQGRRHQRHRPDQAGRAGRLRGAEGLRRLPVRGRELNHFPAGQSAQAGVEPIYETMPGWNESTQGARSWADLPATAVKYIRRIEELIEAPVAMVSTSPERDDTILVTDPFPD